MHMHRIVALNAAFVTLLLCLSPHAGEAAGARPLVRLQRVPDSGIQPQAVAEPSGRIHLIYYKGEHAAGDVYYVRSEDGGNTFTDAIRVNSEPNTVVAAGGVRGAHLALGREGRVHIAWMGARKGQPEKGHGHDHVDVPMWYARLDDSGLRFEPQRNLLTISGGLDGGGSVAADDQGNVYVAWHGTAKNTQARDESQRQVWLRTSRDDGKTFSAEAPVTMMGEGVCACCGMRAFAAPDGNLLLLHRSATNFVNRDMMLSWGSPGQRLTSIKLDPWQVSRCPMSTATMALAPGSPGSPGSPGTPAGAVLAWETDGRVFVARFNMAAARPATPIEPPGKAEARKHPSVAVGKHVALAWTEGMGWNRGGQVAWQVFDQQGKPIADSAGKAPGVPAFGLVSIVSQPDGTFVLFY